MDMNEETLLIAAEAIMRRVDDFKTVAVNGYDNPGMRELLLSATREVFVFSYNKVLDEAIEAVRNGTKPILTDRNAFIMSGPAGIVAAAVQAIRELKK